MRHLSLLLLIMTIVACRNEDTVIGMEDTIIDNGTVTATGEIKGMYLLCEGNMGSNKATIDYLDLSGADGQVHYQRNIFASRNPTAVKELGDVGNDIQVYGSRLWITVNCSNKVEVCTAGSCTRIGQVNIPNCRYVAFHEGYAYISSYAGPVQLGSTQLGRIYKVDTLTLKKVDSVTVGRQPEEIAIAGNKLYVANSGGYTPQNYDNTISVINLATMTEERKITVAPNPHRLQKDHLGQLWVSCRSDNNNSGSKLYCLTPDAGGEMHVCKTLDIPVSNMCIVGDTLYYIGTSYSNVTQSNTYAMGTVNVRTRSTIDSDLFSAPEIKAMKMPYGIIVNPENKSFFLMDAKNYVSSGELLHFNADGTFAWRQWTGDIPSRAVFVGTGHADTEQTGSGTTDNGSRWIAAVDEYVPAPGQFVNQMPQYEAGDDATSMARKCTQMIAGEAGGMVSLGGFGGYITFHFDHPVQNIDGENDFMIMGNATYGGSEPGIVMVSQDTNGNGLPDDAWYELSGSADIDSIGKVTYGYEITYSYNPKADIAWRDNRGNSGYMQRNMFHEQEYYPLWLTQQNGGTMTFRGTLLPPNGHKEAGDEEYWILDALRYGYADNLPNSESEGCSFNIERAVDPDSRRPISLTHIDFIRVYSATNQQCGWVGEISTEITGAQDLHFHK